MVKQDIEKSSSSSFLSKKFTILKRLIFLYIQYKQAIKIHKKYKINKNYYLSKFEDLITNPELNLKRLCEFLDIDYKEDMLHPPIVDSSYGKSLKKQGFDINTLDRWKNFISPVSELLIRILLRSEMREIEYF